MIITMHCGGMPFNGDTLKTKSLGGSESAAYYVAKELASRGHRVTLFTNEQEEGFFDGVKYVWSGPVTEQAPLGERFMVYATNTPHDVLILQRMPGAFIHRFQSKVNISWLHDLGLYRQKGSVASGLWNIDAFFCVSEWHKKQLCEVYGLDPKIVMPVQNGVDLSLFEGKINYKLHKNKKDITLLYSSRPERGLEHHIRPGGIMDRLWEIDQRFHLYVCTYDNQPPQLQGYYQMIYNRIEKMPNVTLLGSLTKGELSDVMRQCDALVYPTEFEEVSCITAMEAMAAGLPMITSNVGALYETCRGPESGTILNELKDGVADEDEFVEVLRGLFIVGTVDDSGLTHADFSKRQKEAAQKFSWSKSVDLFELHFKKLFEDRIKNPETVLKHLIHNSDYYAAEKYIESEGVLSPLGVDNTINEMVDCYAFARDRMWKEHYEAYYEYEKSRGVEYGPEDVTNSNRYQCVAANLSTLLPGSTVLDYGCAHGHYTVNLAKEYPELNFIGIDIADSNIQKARAWVLDEGIKNTEFYSGSVDTGSEKTGIYLNSLGEAPKDPLKFDAIIVAEVLEHVEAPWEMIDQLASHLNDGGKIITTTPIGPWEAIGYEEHWPWRAHVHHLEREDLYELYGMHPNFKMTVAASGHDTNGDCLGSYVCVFDKPTTPSGRIDYDRKLRTLAPTQTLAVCIIAKDAENSLGRCLESVQGIADEIIVAVDETTMDLTRSVAEKYIKGFSLYNELLFDIKSPMEIGFDEARNQCIAHAKADWILWIDADEVLYHPENVRKYLRENMFDAYALKQIHYSVEPAGVMKVDIPARLFRNNKGIKFFGVVHEHPEVELNKGIGHATILTDVVIAHYGYSTESVRRSRFDRNIGLLVRDREKYPTRQLGKFLWVRDLAQMCRWEGERNGGQVTPTMIERAKMGLKIWEELLEEGQTRMLADPDNLGFYSTLVQILGEGFDFGFTMDASKLNGGAHPEKQPPLSARFYSRGHAEKLFLKLLDEKTSNYDSKYF